MTDATADDRSRRRQPRSAAADAVARRILFDIMLWGGIAILLIISFGPANMGNVPLLFTNSDNMQRVRRPTSLQPDFTDVDDSTSPRCG